MAIDRAKLAELGEIYVKACEIIDDAFDNGNITKLEQRQIIAMIQKGLVNSMHDVKYGNNKDDALNDILE